MEKRLILFISLVVMIVLATQLYIIKTSPPPLQHAAAPQAASGSETPAATATGTPAAPQTLAGAAPTPASTPPAMARAKAPKIALATKVYEIEFSTAGAVPSRWDIVDPNFVVHTAGDAKNATQTLGREELINPILDKNDQVPRPFETVLKEANAQYYKSLNTCLYASEKISKGTLTGYRFTSEPTDTGLRMIKTYLFAPNDFVGRLEIELFNEGHSNLSFDSGGGAGMGLVLGPGLGQPATGAMARWSTVDPFIASGDTLDYKTLKKPGDTEDFLGTNISWGGIQNMYFMAALIPGPGTAFTSARAMIDPSLAGVIPDKDVHGYPDVELYGPAFPMKPGERVKFTYQLFVGPKQSQVLKAAGKQTGQNLGRVLFHTSWWWMRDLELGLMAMLAWLFTVFKNWGVAIIALTIIVRLVTFPLVQKGMTAQAKMTAEQARLKPLMDKINEKYKSDPQRKQQEIFKLYKEHGVNPFGMFKGCLWMMIQMPILFALYKLFYQSIELRGAPFLWIQDLAQPDRLVVFKNSLPVIGNEFNLLPLLMGITQVLTSKFSQQPSTDPQQQQMQKTMTYFMPVFMLFIFYSMPAGLVLYWLVSNLWQVLQQLWVNKHIRKPQAPATPAAAPGKA